MDAATATRAQILPFPKPQPPQPSAAPAPPVAAQPPVVAAWPRPALYAGIFILGGLTFLLATQALSYLRSGAQPTELLDAQPISYRVDLNEARRAELMQLPGIGATLADRIEEYRRLNGGFRNVDELLKVKGIGQITLERLRPFVTVKSGEKTAAVETAVKVSKEPKAGNKLASLTEPIDVNLATQADLQRLPGIGPKKSQAIIDEREKRPFSSVDDLRRVPGIGPKTLEQIRPHVKAGNPAK
jgi:competence ComEA-like helix-hairpin-helix protein